MKILFEGCNFASIVKTTSDRGYSWARSILKTCTVIDVFNKRAEDQQCQFCEVLVTN